MENRINLNVYHLFNLIFSFSLFIKIKQFKTSSVDCVQMIGNLLSSPRNRLIVFGLDFPHFHHSPNVCGMKEKKNKSERVVNYSLWLKLC